MFELVENIQSGARIKVIGVGGSGGNAVNTMISTRLEGVDFIAANTDLQALRVNRAPTKIQLGCELTKGLGAGSNPEIGKNAALEDQKALAEILAGADMVFITAGMGGGTGTGAAPIIAKVAKEMGALTVGVVTKPFSFEGKRRSRVAEEGIAELKSSVDTLITIPNEKLLSIAGSEMTLLETFKKADEVLLHAVKGISDLITVHGLINLDFADVRAIMAEMGMALMGSGVSSGENRAIDAATKAISSPLLENISIRGATGILINITGGPNLTLHEVNEASHLIQEEAHEEANIIFGAVIDESMSDDVRVTVIATGFNKSARTAQKIPLRSTSAKDAPRPVQTPMWAPRQEAPQPRVETPQMSYAAKPVDNEPSLMLAEVNESNSYAASPKKSYLFDDTDLKQVVQEVGISDFQEDEYDIPTFLRKQAD